MQCALWPQPIRRPGTPAHPTPLRPDLKQVCDDVRCAGNRVAYSWTFTGTHAATKNPLRVVAWEEWDLGPGLEVVASRGWYDADDYERQFRLVRGVFRKM